MARRVNMYHLPGRVCRLRKWPLLAFPRPLRLKAFITLPELNRSLDFRRVTSPAPEIAKSPGEGASHSLRLVAKDYYVKTYGEIQLPSVEVSGTPFVLSSLLTPTHAGWFWTYGLK